MVFKSIDTWHRFLDYKPPPAIGACFNYYSPVFLKLEYFPIGVLNRILQIAILGYVVNQIVREQSWAYSETPLGTVNAFGGEGDGFSKLFYMQTKASTLAQLDYCGNESHAFQYDAVYDYKVPECRMIPAEQMVIKALGGVQFVTVFLERTIQGWPCNAADSVSRIDACKAGGGYAYNVLGTTAGSDSDGISRDAIPADGQCNCWTSKTVYPMGSDEMMMSFEHTYQFPNGDKGLQTFKGASTLSAEAVDLNPEVKATLPTTIVYKNGTTRALGEGKSVSLSLREWLELAEVDLDHYNTIADFDNLDRKSVDGKSKRLPFYRMTGMIINVLIDYSNGDPQVAENPNVFANVKANKQFLGWAGPGSERIHVQYPTGELGASYFTYVDRYAQGVTFAFSATGRVYAFDYIFLVNTLVAGVVLLGVAGTVTDMIAFNLLVGGHSAVLAAHRRQGVNKRQGFADLAMRTVLAANVFKQIDADATKFIEAEDIVRILATVEDDDFTYNKKVGDKKEEVPFDAEKAHAIAVAILMDQEGKSATPDSFSFKDFMRTQDNGTLPFPEFLDIVRLPKEGPFAPTDEEKARVAKAWQEGKRSKSAHNEEKKARRQEHAKLFRQPTEGSGMFGGVFGVQKFLDINIAKATGTQASDADKV